MTEISAKVIAVMISSGDEAKGATKLEVAIEEFVKENALTRHDIINVSYSHECDLSYSCLILYEKK